jgi:hypothetical protein
MIKKFIIKYESLDGLYKIGLIIVIVIIIPSIIGILIDLFKNGSRML